MLLRRILLPLFILFYFVSSFAATHYRAAEASRRVTHARVQGEAVELTESSESSRDAYPRFREAKKKAGVDLDFGLPSPFDLSPRSIIREFNPATFFKVTHEIVRVLSDRAPPSHI
jgi:hypothetical protein